jgi:hypothetical protein
MFESEIVLALVIGLWIAYEVYGHWFTAWGSYIRIAGGIAVIGYLYWQMRDQPDQFKDTLDMAKQLLIHKSSGSGFPTTEKRNVSGLMKKRVAAGQQWKCGKCSQTLDETYEVDHKLALYKGGSNDMSNLVALCPNCHRLKTVDERLES